MSVELILNPDEDGEGEGFDLAPNAAWRKLAASVNESDYKGLDALASGKRISVAEVNEDIETIRADADADTAVSAVIERLARLTADMDEEDVLLVA